MSFCYCFSSVFWNVNIMRELLDDIAIVVWKQRLPKRAEALFFFYKFIHFCKGIKIYLWMLWNVSSAFLWWKNNLSQRVCKTSLVDQTICYYIFHSGSVWHQYILDFLINFKLLGWTQNIFSTGSVVKRIWYVIHYS